MSRRWAAELRHHWFETLSPSDWWRPTRAVDAELERRFLGEWLALRRRPADEFLGDPEDALAAVLLFDQVPRNVFRNRARAYASDRLALAITHRAIGLGFDRRLGRAERQFLYMPLMHSEAIADQLLSLAKFRALGRGFGWPFARSHYRAVARFGRYPHRNEVLGRKSTPAEKRAIADGMAW